MRLTSPGWLWLLVPVACVVVAYLLAQRRRSRYAVKFATLPMLERLVPARPGWRRHLPAALLLLAFGLLSLAAARPQVDVKVPRERADVIVVIDVSLSMQATDVSPTRIEAARDAAQRFVRGLPAGFDVGVVTFAGSTTVLSRPTTDRQATIDSLDELTLGPKTAIGEGVFTSLDQLASLTTSDPPADSDIAPSPGATDPDGSSGGEDAVPKEIVLLSDGANTVGRGLGAAAAAARAADVPVSTIAYGTPQGTVTVDGSTVAVPVDEGALATLASDTDGQSYVAETGDELDAVYDDIKSSIGERTEQRDATSYAVAAALLVGLLAAAFSLRWFSRLP